MTTPPAPTLDQRVDVLARMVDELHDRIDWLETHTARNALDVIQHIRDQQPETP